MMARSSAAFFRKPLRARFLISYLSAAILGFFL
jgi:hypothetical protein